MVSKKVSAVGELEGVDTGAGREGEDEGVEVVKEIVASSEEVGRGPGKEE